MKPTPSQRDLQLQIVFAFTIIYAGLLFIARPQPNAGQVVLRLSMALIGLGGLGYVEWRKRRRRP